MSEPSTKRPCLRKGESVEQMEEPAAPKPIPTISLQQGEFTIPNILDAIIDVTKWKDLGIQLGLKSSRLNRIEESCHDDDEYKVKMITQWLKQDEDASWDKLQKALESPAMCENLVSKGIADRRGSSFDKGSVLSLQSLESSNSELLDFTEANVRNAIVRIKNIRELGELLKIPDHLLDDIEKLLPEKQKQKFVETWFKVDVDCNWKKLNAAIKKVKMTEWIMNRSQSGSMTESLLSPTASITSNQSFIVQEEELMIAKNAEKENLAMIARKHAKLLMDLTKNLTKAEPDVEDFHQFVVDLFGAGDSIPEANSVRDILRALSKKKYWNFLDVSHLESIVEMFSGDLEEQNAKLIGDYKEKLAGFKAATKINDYICQYEKFKDDDDDEEDVKGIKAMEEKYDKEYRIKLSVKLFESESKFGSIKISMQSLVYVEELWKRLCSEFHMPSLPRVLDSIVPGSILMHWLIRHIHACRVLEKLGDTGTATGVVEFFKKESIINVYIEEICVYDQDTGVANERILGYVKLLIVVHERDQDKANSMLEQLLPDVNVPISQEGRTALMFAAQHGNRRMAELLMDNHADMYLHDQNGLNVLSLSEPHTEVHNWLRSKLEDKFITSAQHGRLPLVEKSLNIGVNPNAKERDEYGWTALLWASENGHSEVVDTLLEHGADVDAEDSSQWTSLILTSRKGYLHIVQKLLDKGADVNKTTNSLWSSLMWTAQSGHTEVAKLLLERGANADTRDEVGFSPLMQASQDGHLEIVKLLVEHQREIDMNQVTLSDWSAVMVATKNGHEDVVRYLVEKGSDIHYQKKDGVTALHIASFKGRNSITRYMCLDQKVKVDVQDRDGISPLMFAAREGQLDVLRTLVENGRANVNLTEHEYEWTAIYFAVEAKHLDVFEYLLRTLRVDVTHKDTEGKTIVDMVKDTLPSGLNHLKKYYKTDTEAILTARRKVAPEPFNVKRYQSMLDNMTRKISANPKTAIAAGAA